VSAMSTPLPPQAMEIIDGYLDALALHVGMHSPAGRRLVAEATEHLVLSVSERIAAGEDPDDAAREEIQIFGDPAVVSAAELSGRLPSAATSLAQLVDLACRVGIVGGFAIALSGVIAWIVGSRVGTAYVVGDIMGVTYTPQRCLQYLHSYPSAGSCEAAAVMDHFDEVVWGRLLLGVLTLGLLGGWLMWRRRTSYRSAPPALVGIVGLCLALLGASVLVLSAANGLLSAGGVGTWAALSAAFAAALAAVWFAVPVVRAVRQGRLIAN
jgi:hypothetical protein